MDRKTVKTSTAPKRKIDVSKLVTKAVGKLESDQGCTLAAVKKYLASEHQMNDAPSIKVGLQNALDKGALVKVDRRYKVRETARRRRRSSGRSRRRSRRRSSGRRRKSRSRKRSGSKRRRSRRRRRSRKAVPEE